MDLELIKQAIVSGDPSRSMPALVGLRAVEVEQAVPLLLLGLEQDVFMVRSLSCAGLGQKRNEVGWKALVEALRHDGDPNVRAEAANALVSHGVARAWPLVREAFERDGQWLVRCSILSALAEQPEMGPAALLQLAKLAVADGDGSVRVGGTEILGRLVLEATDPGITAAARELLVGLQQDGDHRVVAAALNGLRG